MDQSHWWRVIQAQLLAVLMTTCLTWGLSWTTLNAAEIVWGGGLAYLFSALIAARLRFLPWWWYPLLASGLPLLLWMAARPVSPVYYLAAFVLLWLFYKDNQRERVPLYLTGHSGIAVLNEWLCRQQPASFADLGCGLGSVVCHLARKHPEIHFTGIESAPLPWLIARWRARRCDNCDIYYGNFWHYDLSTFDMVYVFLSPQPMSRLWLKASKEMRAGSCLVSYQFEIPEVEADLIEADAGDKSPMYLWAMGARFDQFLSEDV